MLPLHGQGPFHGLAQVELEVKAIRYLHGVRRSLSRSLGILTLPIAPQYLHSRMLAQPQAEHLCGTGRQDIYHFVPLKIDEDGAERHSLLPGPIVYSQHADRRGSRMPRCLFELAQQGMPTDRHTESPQQARTGTPAQSSAHTVLVSARSLVWRAYGSRTPGRRSVKIRPWHCGVWQRQRPTRRSRVTETPCSGRSRSRPGSYCVGSGRASRNGDRSPFWDRPHRPASRSRRRARGGLSTLRDRAATHDRTSHWPSTI